MSLILDGWKIALSRWENDINFHDFQQSKMKRFLFDLPFLQFFPNLESIQISSFAFRAYFLSRDYQTTVLVDWERGDIIFDPLQNMEEVSHVMNRYAVSLLIHLYSKLIFLWLKPVRNFAFDPLSNCSNWIKSEFSHN